MLAQAISSRTFNQIMSRTPNTPLGIDTRTYHGTHHGCVVLIFSKTEINQLQELGQHLVKTTEPHIMFATADSDVLKIAYVQWKNSCLSACLRDKYVR